MDRSSPKKLEARRLDLDNIEEEKEQQENSIGVDSLDNGDGKDKDDNPYQGKD